MSYKTILVHLGNETRARSALGYAVELARTYSAHLIGLYVFPAFRLTPPIPLPFGGDIAGQIRASIRQDMEKIKAVFDEFTAAQPFSAEWRSITTERRDPEEIVLEHARAADLIVASQADPDWSLTDVLDFPDSLALHSGRPVVVVPGFGKPPRPPRVALVAWNASRESARAVADAMPLLRDCKSTFVLTVDDGSRAAEGALPDTEFAAALARHGVKVEIEKVKPGEFTIGEELRVRAHERSADLIVMGCYGHSRLREFAFGGVTRHLLRDMTIPILFSH